MTIVKIHDHFMSRIYKCNFIRLFQLFALEQGLTMQPWLT